MSGLKHRLTATYSESTGPFEPFSLTTPRRRRKKERKKHFTFNLPFNSAQMAIEEVSLLFLPKILRPLIITTALYFCVSKGKVSAKLQMSDLYVYKACIYMFTVNTIQPKKASLI